MKTSMVAALVLAAALPARAADVGVSISISQPGVYGRIDIGRYPQPVLVVPRPVVIAPPPVVVAAPQPVYMWMPPGHRRHWHKHCAAYGACGVPVYFVDDRWYDKHVMSGRGRGHARGRDD